jgi:hypothetical protein
MKRIEAEKGSIELHPIGVVPVAMAPEDGAEGVMVDPRRKSMPRAKQGAYA